MADSAPPSWEQPDPWVAYESLDKAQYRRVDWASVINFDTFRMGCRSKICRVEKYRRKLIPWRCSECRQRKALMWVEARYREREKAEEEVKALAERARAENPDLFRLERLWMPLEEGVALIRGGLLLDVASFFCDCWIVVCEHNKPATDLRIGALGRDIVDNSTGPVFKDFTRSYVQVRVHIAKFYPPSDTDDLEHPGEAALCGLRGDHGDAVCRLMLFLGSTGRRESGTVDKGCSYWFHSAGGFKDKDNLTIGETPSRMVRLPNSPLTDFYDIMMRLDLETGKENAKDFCDKFNENVRQWKVCPMLCEDFPQDGFPNVYVESSEDDDTEMPNLTVSPKKSEAVPKGYEFLPKLIRVIKESLPPPPPSAKKGEGPEASIVEPQPRRRSTRVSRNRVRGA